MQQEKCGVYLISGFLGSGKTTLLRHLLENVPAGVITAVLINEFGKAGVDGDVMRRDGIELIEINKGSIFCACAKGDFLRALYTLFRDYKPSVLLVEASGAADTTDMKHDLLHGMLRGFFVMRGNVCVVDAKRFEDWADIFSAVQKQVAAATHIIINKIDLVTQEEADKVEIHVHSINPEAPVTRTKFSMAPWSVFSAYSENSKEASALPAADVWDKFIEDTLSGMTAHMAPPDRLVSVSIFWEGEPEKFKEILKELPDDIVRAKGFFQDADKKWLIFDIVGHVEPVYSIPDENFSVRRNLAVFIRKKVARREIRDMFTARGIKVLEMRCG